MNQSTLGSTWGEFLWGRNALRCLAVVGGVALHATNVYIAATIMPSVVLEIGGLQYYAANTTLFVVSSIVGSALSSRLMASFGARSAYLSALAIFALGTLLCATAPTMPWMLAGRAVQGLGGGFLFALSYGLIRHLFEERMWPRAMAMISAMWGLATLCGPAIGGVFAELGTWRLAFWSLLPFVVVLGGVVATQLPRRGADGEETTRTALVQVLLLAASVLAVSVSSLSETPGIGKIAGVVVGILMGVVLARVDKRAAVRLLPTGAYSLRTMLGRLYATMSLLVVGLTTEIFVPYFLQEIHGCSPLRAGYLTVLMAGGWTIASLLFSGRVGAATTRLIRIGPVLVSASLATLAVTMPRTTQLESPLGMTVFGIALVGTGFGIGMAWPHLLTRVFTSAPENENSLTAASVTTVQLYAMALGTAIGGLVTNAGGMSTGGLAGAQHASSWLFGVFALAPFLGIWQARRLPHPSK
ncbi:MFS transporter [Labilithrix luteola]|nr:MFS transporter [Labilithrix luteola]